MNSLLKRILARGSVTYSARLCHRQINMASADDTNKENEPFEQVVTMEKVVAADNRGIDYNKLISE